MGILPTAPPTTDRVEIGFRLTTPCFAASLRQEEPRLTAGTVKGAIRFWWRALAWQRLGGGDIADATRHPDILGRIALEEARLFGRQTEETGPGKKLGQAMVRVEVHGVVAPKDVEFPCARNFSRIGTRYLCGQGLSERKALPAETVFTLCLSFKRTCRAAERKCVLDAADRKSVLDAVELFGLIGGLGSRSRRAFGSVRIESWGDRMPPTSVSDYVQRIEKLTRIVPGQSPLPPYSAFSPLAQFDVVRPTKHLAAQVTNASVLPVRKMDDAIELLGAGFLWYRSNGRGGTVRLGQRSPSAGSRFCRDHDWFDAIRCDPAAWLATPPPAPGLPERLIFGAPHNYFSDRLLPVAVGQLKVDVGVEDDGRRASPLLLHIHRLDNEYYFTLVSLPAEFLPSDARIARNVALRQQEVINGRLQYTNNGKPKIAKTPTIAGTSSVTCPGLSPVDFRAITKFATACVGGGRLFDEVK